MSTPKHNDDISAFPSHGSMSEATQKGMDLRDFFAAQIASGDAASDEAWSTVATQEAIDLRVRFYYQIADAMIKARKK